MMTPLAGMGRSQEAESWVDESASNINSRGADGSVE